LRWVAGALFSTLDERRGMHPPQVPIAIDTVPEAPELPNIYPVLTWTPIPLMSRRLVDALRSAGVANLQTFETRLASVQGDSPPPTDHYLAVNIVGCIAAADLARSQINPEVPDRLVSTDFYALAIDVDKAGGQLMFRLAENVSAVLVHQRVKAAVEAAGIDSLTWLPPQQWAG
jgi:hypothetical protein